ncbi:TATA-box-binding protein 2 [Halalkalicoccus paucihalophilus]|uniref:TATA-box-binding protein n=1 Tax=Halalkalicoccus paucihalophilus TaxID=1008153 RepID=A0A151A909_9EURY|nr:TATA-box-binding protein [Halalkalicoccus paucihalophilus]KYH24083.1 TATA-box-binding protein 2 [Halalkalicoccus paucihalophilus]
MAPSTSVEVQNIVASTKIAQEVDLNTLCQDLDRAQHSTGAITCLTYRLQEPKIAINIHQSGKLIITGAKSVQDVYTGFYRLFDELRELHIDLLNPPHISIDNVVTSADLGQSVDLAMIAITLGVEQIEYEPEQFPALIYWLEKPSAVVMLFASGKMVITGCTTKKTATEVLEIAVSQVLDA